jgi:hypothetical protein
MVRRAAAGHRFATGDRGGLLDIRGAHGPRVDRVRSDCRPLRRKRAATLFYHSRSETALRGGAQRLAAALAEVGALVCIPAGLVILSFAWTVHRRFREVSVESSNYWIRIGQVTGILAIALQEISDFSLQMPGNAVLFTPRDRCSLFERRLRIHLLPRENQALSLQSAQNELLRVIK